MNRLPYLKITGGWQKTKRTPDGFEDVAGDPYWYFDKHTKEPYWYLDEHPAEPYWYLEEYIKEPYWYFTNEAGDWDFSDVTTTPSTTF